MLLYLLPIDLFRTQNRPLLRLVLAKVRAALCTRTELFNHLVVANSLHLLPVFLLLNLCVSLQCCCGLLGISLSLSSGAFVPHVLFSL